MLNDARDHAAMKVAGAPQVAAVDSLATVSTELPGEWLSLVTIVPPQGASTVQLPGDLEKRHRELTSVNEFHSGADLLDSGRQVEAAYRLLRKGAARDADAGLWRRLIETGLRSKINPKELTRLIVAAGDTEEVFDEEDSELSLLRGRILLQRVLSDDQSLESTVQVKLLESAIGDFRKGMDLAMSPRDRAQSASWLCLATSRLHYFRKLPVSDSELEAALGLAAEATRVLEPLWRSNTAEVSEREALATALLGQGFLSLSLSDQSESNRLASLSFAAAVDVRASLPFETSGLAQFGTPLIRLLRSSVSESDTEQLERERTRRKSLSLLASGVLALHLHSPELAIQRLAEGLQTLGQQTSDQARNMEAEQPMDALALFTQEAASGLSQIMRTLSTYRLLAETDQNLTARKSVSSLVSHRTALLAESEADPYRSPLRHVLDPSENHAETARRLSELLRGQSDPVRQLAVLRAVEEHIVSLSAKSPFRQILQSVVPSSTAARPSASEDPSLQRIQQEIRNTKRRITSADTFLDEAAVLASRMQWLESATVLDEGLLHHPLSELLWKQRLELQLRMAEHRAFHADGNDKYLRSALELLRLWQEVVEDRSPVQEWLAAQVELNSGQLSAARDRLEMLLEGDADSYPVPHSEVLAALAATRARLFAAEHLGTPPFSETSKLTTAFFPETTLTGK